MTLPPRMPRIESSDPPPRVLIVETLVELARVLVERFEREGFVVEVCADAASAWRSLERQRPDVIVVNEKIDDHDGRTLSASFDAAPRLDQVPRIVLTARPAPPSTAGASAPLALPFRPQELVDLVRERL